ncbi:MAG: LytTR family DNA-binding domain-containing protein [Clostridiales bacterium]|nr:LytTR family DNA-binding domain-containing protein [Clostridiales bacterium]
MKIAILDDNPEDSETLTRSCESWAADFGVQITCDSFESGEEFLMCFQPKHYDLLFLDIYMKKLTGIDIARRVRKTDVNCLLVFVTTSREHALESMPFHPFDYLIKPSEPRRVAQVLTEAARTIPQNYSALELTCGRTKVSVYYNDLISLEADRHHAFVRVLKREPMRCYIDSFSGLWNTLQEDSRFILCNRGIILNMDQIEKIGESEFVMKNGEIFPIRQNNKNEVIQTFLTYQYDRAKKYGKRYFT